MAEAEEPLGLAIAVEIDICDTNVLSLVDVVVAKEDWACTSRAYSKRIGPIFVSMIIMDLKA